MAIPPKVLILHRLSIHMKNLEIPVHNLQVIPQVLTVAAGTNLVATIFGVFIGPSGAVQTVSSKQP